jgi:hypothetical protein
MVLPLKKLTKEEFAAGLPPFTIFFILTTFSSFKYCYLVSGSSRRKAVFSGSNSLQEKKAK